MFKAWSLGKITDMMIKSYQIYLMIIAVQELNVLYEKP